MDLKFLIEETNSQDYYYMIKQILIEPHANFVFISNSIQILEKFIGYNYLQEKAQITQHTENQKDKKKNKEIL